MKTNRQAMTAARKAAVREFDDYLTAAKATATMYVPQCVIDAAETAFRVAGGTGKIVVAGHGNTTHPVCGVSVRLDRTA